MEPSREKDEVDSERLQQAVAGAYHVERELGRGGMATVYLARDLRHRRAVAIKVLHPQLSAALGPERFLREIELTASLQHPHILPLFDSGAADGLLYYVMPYVQGETLRVRLERERLLPVADAVRIAAEVAGALDYAHRHGVIHRDIKPENILVHDGAALVADFGIALAIAQADGARITQSGLSIGTPQYMAPEQAMGERAIDARADVFALGVVLYEMLAGEAPFAAPTAQGMVARVMTERPRPLAARRDTVPPHVEAAIMTALAKEPADRFPTAAAFAAALASPGIPIVTPVALPVHAVRRAGWRAPVALVASAVIGWAAASAYQRVAAAPEVARESVRFVVAVDSGTLASGDFWSSAPAISPDGRTIVYAVSGQGGARLYARNVDDLIARPLPGTEDADWPFFSPDGAWVGFASRGALRKVRLTGGAPVTIAELRAPEQFFGADWAVRDTIIFSVLRSGALYRVPAEGGRPVRIAVQDTSIALTHPRLLPDGRSLLVTAVVNWTVGRIGVLDLATGRLRRFGPGTGARYLAGHLYYAGAAGELFRQAFDEDALALQGNPEQIASGLDVVLAANAAFDVSATGTLVYRASAGRSKLTLTDRTGRTQATIAGSLPWEPRFSPDGRRIAFAANGPGPEVGDVWARDVWLNDIWIADVESGALQRVTTDGSDNNEPGWSRDGATLVYSSARRPGDKDVYLQRLDGTPARSLVGRPGLQFPSDLTPDGRALLFVEEPDGGTYDIWVQPLDGGAARPYLATSARELNARISPDGRSVAYTSDVTGRTEVYLQGYPIPGPRVLVSTRGGTRPVWGRDGRQLYFWEQDQLIAARLETRGAGLPEEWSRSVLFRSPEADPESGYDVSPDGARFAIVTGAPRANRLVVAVNALDVSRVRPR